MADKAITDLNVVPGSIDDNNTWFAVAQSGAAYKVSGHEFVLAMSVIWESHGGIRDIVYTDPVPPSLTGTLTITLADDTEVSFDVDNGKGITSIAKTGTVDLVDTYTITYNDGTTSTFTVTNGAKGDTGDAWYVWIRYAGEEPTQDSDIGTDPDNWMGIYSGTSSTAPVHYTDYDWFQIKGEKGDTGTAATLVSNDIQYQQSDSGSVVPSGSWSATVPAPVAGKYLWTRTVLTFNSGSPVTFYSVARYGIDGTGAVSSVNSVSPDGNGNVSLVANDIPTAGGTSVEADLSGVKNTLTKLIPILPGSTNNLGYTLNVGDYFEAGGVLYKVTTAIPNTEAWAGKASALTDTVVNDLNYSLSQLFVIEDQSKSVSGNTGSAKETTITVSLKSGYKGYILNVVPNRYNAENNVIGWSNLNQSTGEFFLEHTMATNATNVTVTILWVKN